MTDAVADVAETAPKRLKVPLVLCLLAILIGGGGGFFAAYSGLILSTDSSDHVASAAPESGALPDVAFVPVDPMLISLNPTTNNQHLHFRAQLEVPSQHATDVEKLMPRVVDVLNGYLRALEIRDLESTAAITRLRAQMLRRVQIVAGTERVNDLLIMEFVIN